MHRSVKVAIAAALFLFFAKCKGSPDRAHRKLAAFRAREEETGDKAATHPRGVLSRDQACLLSKSSGAFKKLRSFSRVARHTTVPSAPQRNVSPDVSPHPSMEASRQGAFVCNTLANGVGAAEEDAEGELIQTAQLTALTTSSVRKYDDDIPFKLLY